MKNLSRNPPRKLWHSESAPEAETPIPETGLELDFSPPAGNTPVELEIAPVPESVVENVVATPEEISPAPRQPHTERGVHDEVDEQLLPIFLEEAHELYPQIGSTLRAWRENPHDAQLGRNLQRNLHTLKGSARMAGAMRLGELTHRVEDRVEKTMAGGELGAELWNELDGYLDRIGNAIEQLQQPRAGAAAEAEQPAVEGQGSSNSKRPRLYRRRHWRWVPSVPCRLPCCGFDPTPWTGW